MTRMVTLLRQNSQARVELYLILLVALSIAITAHRIL